MRSDSLCTRRCDAALDEWYDLVAPQTFSSETVGEVRDSVDFLRKNVARRSGR
jgi:ribosomal protein S3AE